MSDEEDRPHFVADAMLGRLARWLRVVGLDTLYLPATTPDAALVARADDMRRAEAARSGTVLDSLDERQRAAVDHLTRRIVSKLLHAPIRNVRRQAGSKQGYIYLQTLRELFELDDDTTS